MRYKDKKRGEILSWCLVLTLVAVPLAPACTAFAGETGSPGHWPQPEPPGFGPGHWGGGPEGIGPEPPAHPGMMRGPMMRGGRMPDKFAERFTREEIRELIEVVRVWRMSRELELTEEQALKLLMANDEHRESVEKMHAEKQGILADLRKALDSEESDGERIEELIEKMDSIDAKLGQAEKEHRDQLLDGLTPEQKAKFYVFRFKFERDIRDLIGRIMHKQRMGGSGGMGGRGGGMMGGGMGGRGGGMMGGMGGRGGGMMGGGMGGRGGGMMGGGMGGRGGGMPMGMMGGENQRWQDPGDSITPPSP